MKEFALACFISALTLATLDALPAVAGGAGGGGRQAVPGVPQDAAEKQRASESRGAGEGPPGAQATRQEAQARLDDLQRAIESLIGRTGDLTQILPATYNDLQSQRDKIALTLAGEKMREKLIQERINDLTKQAQDQIEKDVTLAQLQTIADKKQKDVARLHELVKSGVVPIGEDDKAVADAAEALVHVQERREAITAAVGGGIVPALNKELISVSLDIAQQEAMNKVLQDKIDRAERARDLYREWVGLSLSAFPIPSVK